jgi:hypothetical protein
MLDRNLIRNQQQALVALGYYQGIVDGIWSRKSIEAKIAYERSGDYNPGVPNNGLPFDTRASLPNRMTVNADGTFNVDGVKIMPEPLIVPDVVAEVVPDVVAEVVPDVVAEVVPDVVVDVPLSVSYNNSNKHQKNRDRT